MKKIILLIIILLSFIGLQAQIKSFSVDASKVYENNTRTSYLTLIGDLDEDIAEAITKELQSHPDIQKFSFYDNTSLMKCMFTANVSVNEKMVVDLINDVVELYSNDASPQEVFSKTEIYSDYMIVYFKVNGLLETAELKSFNEILENDDMIFSVGIFDDGLFKLKTDLNLTPAYINRKLVEFNSKIEQEYIR